MLIIPWNTDAPLYHPPIGTGILIAICTLVGILQMQGVIEDPTPYWLLFGEIRPHQWITCQFFHLDVFHWLGNMFGIWAFGLVVEGKLGLWRFLAVYLLIGGVQAAAEQLWCWGITPDPLNGEPIGSAGASGAIYGLIAISLVWAPRNELNVVLIFFAFIRIFVQAFDVTILTFSAWMIGLQLLVATLTGFRISSEMIHLMGAGLGFGVGILFLKKNWVDCEGWDVFNVWAGNHLLKHRMEDYHYALPTSQAPRRTKTFEELTGDDESDQRIGAFKKKKKGKSDLLPTGPMSEDDCRLSLVRLQEAIDANQPMKGYREYQRLKHPENPIELPLDVLFKLAGQLHENGSFLESIPVMERCLNLAPDKTQKMRVLAAELILEHQQRAEHALRLLDGIDRSRLDDKWRRRAQDAAIEAQQMLDDAIE